MCLNMEMQFQPRKCGGGIMTCGRIFRWYMRIIVVARFREEVKKNEKGE